MMDKKSEMLRIYTDKPVGEVASTKHLRLMVGDTELAEVTKVVVDLEGGDIVTATITLAVRLGE